MKISYKILMLLLLISSQTFSQFSWNMPRENLKVLPDTISGNELRTQMVAFSQSLGVRCWYCHDDANGKELTQINFASDAKPQKLIAREMIRMAKSINGDFISEVRKINSTADNVACMTCHRGYPKPKHLFQVLLESYNNEGIAAAINTYHELKNKYYGGFTFDFRENSLNLFGYQVMAQSKFEDALKIFQLNAELFPESFNVYDSIGEVYLKMGDKNKAVQNYKKSLKLNPGNKSAKKVLENIEGK